MHVTARTVRDYFDTHQSKRPLLPDANSVSGYGSLLKYSGIADVISKPEYASVLDVGCNSGPIEYLYEQNNHDASKPRKLIVGVDVSELAIEQANSLKLRLSKFLPYDGSVLPFGNNSFDLVVLSEVIEHIPDKRNMLLEILRILRPGGCLLITTPNPECWALRCEQFLWTVIRKLLGKRQPLKDIFISADHLTALLQQVGFSVSKHDGKYVWPHLFISFLSWSVLPPLPPSLWMKYQKMWLSVLEHVKLPSFVLKRAMWTVWVLAKKEHS